MVRWCRSEGDKRVGMPKDKGKKMKEEKECVGFKKKPDVVFR